MCLAHLAPINDEATTFLSEERKIDTISISKRKGHNGREPPLCIRASATADRRRGLQAANYVQKKRREEPSGLQLGICQTVVASWGVHIRNDNISESRTAH